jgi:hypothetical protein
MDGDYWEHMRVTKLDLMKTMPTLRNLFRLRGFDVSRYTDEQIANAMLAACPESHSAWPTDEELGRAFRVLHLTCGGKSGKKRGG